MTIKEKKHKEILDVKVFGTTSLGARGQIVIPKDARDSLSCKSGDKFVVMGKAGCLMLIPQALAVKFVKQISDALIS